MGSLAPELLTALDAEPGLARRLAQQLLDANFLASLHADICIDIGLDFFTNHSDATETAAVRRRGASHKLRDLVFTAYEYRCAFCSFDGMLSGRPVGLEAAHVRWWSHGGSDQLDNLVCLCVIHHNLLDKGVFGLSDNRKIMVSRKFVARSPAGRQHVLDLVGQPMITPQLGSEPVHPDHIRWHATQVFKDEGRTVAHQ